MPKITYIPHAQHTGAPRTIEGSLGSSVMEAAIQNGVPGIQALCGGSCACATCHVYVDPEWLDRTGEASEMEQGMLELAVAVAPSSRLSCQIKITQALDGCNIGRDRAPCVRESSSR